MFFTKANTTDLDTRSTVKAAKRARKASSAAAANATDAVQYAAVAAKNAKGVAQNAAQNAAVAATNTAQNAAVAATNAAQSAAAVAAQNAREVAQTAAQNARDVAQSAAQNARDVAQSAAQNAAVVATNAAQNASDVAATAATGLSRGVRQGVFTARSWAAPRLESAADYTTATIAPKVSEALRTTARQVSPADSASSKRASVLRWTLLGGAVLAGLGAVAAVLRHRYQAAIAADSEAVEEESSGTQAKPSEAAKPTDQGTDTSVNGRVAATGW